MTTVKLTRRQAELLSLSIHNPERHAEINAGEIPADGEWKEILSELCDRDEYPAAELRVYRTLLKRLRGAGA